MAWLEDATSVNKIQIEPEGTAEFDRGTINTGPSAFAVRSEEVVTERYKHVGMTKAAAITQLAVVNGLAGFQGKAQFMGGGRWDVEATKRLVTVTDTPT